MTKTNTEKSKVIAERLVIELHILTKTSSGLKCSCGKTEHDREYQDRVLHGRNQLQNHSEQETPDFFTPDGQVVLAKVLLKKENGRTFNNFLLFLGMVACREALDESVHLITVIAQTKLAELFYEFIESEGK